MADYTLKNTWSTIDATVTETSAEKVSVLRYGALGNGTHDDTSAIQAAINTGKPVYFPKGNFLISGNLTVNNKDLRLIGKGARIFSNNPMALVVRDCHLIEGITFDNIKIYIEYKAGNSPILIRNNVFLRSDFGIMIAIGANNAIAEKVSIIGNYFDTTRDCIFAQRLEKGSIIGNTFIKETNATWYEGACIRVYGCNESIIANNYCFGGIVGISLITTRTVSGPYSVCKHTIITGNTVVQASEEGICLDLRGNEPTNTGSLISGTVRSKTNNSITPSFAIPAGGYQNYYLILLSGAEAGEYDKITSNSTSALTLEKFNTAKVQVGDQILVFVPHMRNVISNNVVTNCGRTGIYLYMNCFDNIVEGNVVYACGAGAENRGISAVYGRGMTQGEYAPCGRNIFTTNVVHDCNLTLNCLSFNGQQSKQFHNIVRNNVVKNGQLIFDQQIGMNIGNNEAESTVITNVTPVKGDYRYNMDENRPQWWDGTTWR